MEYTKPALTLGAQADRLIERGMKGDRGLIIQRLGTVSYYRLTGYWHPFRNADDTFKENTHFEEVWNRYAFDRRLRCLVLDAIERFEISLRTMLSYEHSHAYGPFAYAINSTSIVNPGGDHFKKFLEEVKLQKDRSRENFVTHFNDKYGDSHDYLPIWMATELMSYGTVMTLYNHCPDRIKNTIASDFGLPKKVFASWLLALNTVRNICAHHGRLWNRVLGVRPSIPKKIEYPDWHDPETIRSDKVYASLTFCRYIMKRVAPQSNWKQRLLVLLSDYPTVPRVSMGFPKDWENSPIWRD